MDGPVETALRSLLQRALAPSHLEVVNESGQHAVPPGSETHFKVVVVSGRFEGLPLIQRHRLVHSSVRDLLASDIHALSIHAKTPEQWAEEPRVDPSPPCLGGSKHDPLGPGKRTPP